MNKICTSLEQSKKLIELGIDVNTADFAYLDGNENGLFILTDKYKRSGYLQYDIPAWSLSALLEILPSTITYKAQSFTLTVLKYGANYLDKYGRASYIEAKCHDNLIDVCVETIIKLKEKNFL